MEIRHFRYFIAVAEELHFARAAERLGIAPSTLTVQIQEIERTLQARLLQRSKRSVRLTSAGELFLEQARASLLQFEQALGVGRRAGRGELGRIMIGYVGSAALAGVLQQHMRLFRSDWPMVQLQASEQSMGRLPELVAEGQVDVGFVRLPMTLPTGLSSHILQRNRFCVALPASHRLAGAQAVDARQLAGDDFVVPEQDLGTREVGRRGGFAPRITAIPGNLLAVLTEVSLWMGVAIVPDVVVPSVVLPDVVYKPLAGAAITSDLAAIFRRNEGAPAVKNLIRQLVSAAPDALAGA
ncbi:LysR substrate-binding domain-containing protein [Massilia sp. TN1-12]|uniref:LysR substrate-binding domain-containing protein n=1 Tax=Massilia paldalensis TaxID=3377675 RepID=UPI003850D058